MREIKFRAWDKILKSMRTFDTFCIYDGKPIDVCEDIDMGDRDIQYERGFVSTYGKVKFNTELILMQYTGLKDKNGKEIYEGDIVQGEIVVGYGPDRDSEASPSPEQIFKEIVAIIIWDDFYMTYKLKRKEDNELLAIFMPNLYTLEDIEVIGNIYENPELLK